MRRRCCTVDGTRTRTLGDRVFVQRTNPRLRSGTAMIVIGRGMRCDVGWGRG